MAGIRDIVKLVERDLDENLNAWIEKFQSEGETWFTPLKLSDKAPRIESDRFHMGVYLASPSGSVFTSDERSASIDITLDCILDDKWDNSTDPENYLSAVLDFLNRREYGVSSMAYTATTMRTDLGAPANGFAVAIKVVIYDIDMDIL